jgi:hypothetical protein
MINELRKSPAATESRCRFEKIVSMKTAMISSITNIATRVGTSSLPTRPFCSKILIIIAVLLKENIAPTNNDERESNPINNATSCIIKKVTSTIRKLITTALSPIEKSFERLNSTPIRNNSRTAPISANAVIVFTSTKFKKLGPSKRPANKSAAT